MHLRANVRDRARGHAVGLAAGCGAGEGLADRLLDPRPETLWITGQLDRHAAAAAVLFQLDGNALGHVALDIDGGVRERQVDEHEDRLAVQEIETTRKEEPAVRDIQRPLVVELLARLEDDPHHAKRVAHGPSGRPAPFARSPSAHRPNAERAKPQHAGEKAPDRSEARLAPLSRL